MIPDDLLSRLAALEGHLTEGEGRRLAELASAVPIDQTIVEIGSYKGKSACYLGVGSRGGAGAPVYCVDLWDLHQERKFSAPGVFASWREQVASFALSKLVTPIRCESALLGRMLSLPIGLLFIDGDHDYQSVARDYHAWSNHIIPGGVLAFHDYAHPHVGADVRRFVDEQVASSGRWSEGEVIDRMYVTRLWPQTAFPPEANDERLTYVSNEELREHLAQRPPQYALDLALIVPRRDEGGIFVDTHSPHYGALASKYRDSARPAPLAARIDAICRGCAVGAECRFRRLPTEERREALLPSRRAAWPTWCRARAWGSEIDVVYPYIAGAAEGDELRYSLRSLEQNLVAQPRVWLIGDKPDWYRGHYIPHQRIRGGPHEARLDRAAKLWVVTRDRRIGGEFLWMMDDLYFLKPVTLHELRQRWRSSEMDPAHLAAYQAQSQWEQEKLLTWQALARAGKPVDDQTPHLPYVYEKDKVRRVFRKYNLLRQPFIDSLLYLNEFATSVPRPREEILYAEQEQPSADEIRRRLEPALILNHAHGSYTPAMQEVLRSLFPTPSRFEHAF